MLGESKIMGYTGSNKDVFIQNKEEGFSIVCYFTSCIIMVVSVIDKADCYIKQGTDVVNL